MVKTGRLALSSTGEAWGSSGPLMKGSTPGESVCAEVSDSCSSHFPAEQQSARSRSAWRAKVPMSTDLKYYQCVMALGGCGAAAVGRCLRKQNSFTPFPELLNSKVMWVLLRELMLNKWNTILVSTVAEPACRWALPSECSPIGRQISFTW